MIVFVSEECGRVLPPAATNIATNIR
jgi:hypothetical protein